MKNKKTDIKKMKKPLSKDAKKIIVVGVVFLILFSIVFGFKIGTKNVINKTTDFKKALNAIVYIMPKSVEVETNSGTIEFFVEKSDEYDTMFDEAYIEETKQYDIDKIDITRALNFYYYNSENKRVDIANGEYKDANNDIWVIGHFIDKLNNYVDTADNAYTGFMVALILGFIIYLIYVWYKAWSAKEDKRIAEIKQLNNPKKNENKE